MNSSPATSTMLLVAVSSQRECTRLPSIGVVAENIARPAPGMPSMVIETSPSPQESRTSVIWKVPNGYSISFVLVIR